MTRLFLFPLKILFNRNKNVENGLTNVPKHGIIFFDWVNYPMSLNTILKRKRTDQKCIKSCVRRS